MFNIGDKIQIVSTEDWTSELKQLESIRGYLIVGKVTRSCKCANCPYSNKRYNYRFWDDEIITDEHVSGFCGRDVDKVAELKGVIHKPTPFKLPHHV